MKELQKKNYDDEESFEGIRSQEIFTRDKMEKNVEHTSRRFSITDQLQSMKEEQKMELKKEMKVQM